MGGDAIVCHVGNASTTHSSMHSVLRRLTHPPTHPTHLPTQVVEECAERLTDDDVDTLCELVATHLGGEAEGEGEGDAGAGMEVSGEAGWVGGGVISVVGGCWRMLTESLLGVY